MRRWGPLIGASVLAIVVCVFVAERVKMSCQNASSQVSKLEKLRWFNHTTLNQHNQCVIKVKQGHLKDWMIANKNIKVISIANDHWGTTILYEIEGRKIETTTD